MSGKKKLNTNNRVGRQKGESSPSSSYSADSASAYSIWENYLKRQEEEEKKKKESAGQVPGVELSSQATNHNAITRGNAQKAGAGIKSAVEIAKEEKALRLQKKANEKALEQGKMQPYANAASVTPEAMEAALKAGAYMTADGKATDHYHVLQTDDPYDLGNEFLNDMMAKNLETAQSWNVKTWDGLNVKDDIRDITRRWYENRKESEKLNYSNPTGKDPVGAADRLMQREMDALRAKYESNGRSYKEQRELMASQGILDPYEIENENKKTAIREANREYRAENPKAQAEWRRMFKDAQAEGLAPDAGPGVGEKGQEDALAYDDLGNVARNVRQGNAYLLSEDELAAYQEFAQANPDVMATNNTQTIQEAAAEWGRQRATQRRQEIKKEMSQGTWEDIQVPRRVMDYAASDKYLREKSDLYGIARDNPEKVEQLAGMLEKAGDTIQKLQDVGVQNLTEDEIYVLNAVRDATGMQDAYGAGISTKEGMQALEAAGKELARQLREQAALYPGLDYNTYEQGLWEALTGTPEGAEYYLENAAGTDKEQEAKANRYFVQAREEAAQLQARPDFADLGKMDPQYLNSEIYAQVNGQEKKKYGTGLGYVQATPNGMLFQLLEDVGKGLNTEGMTEEQIATFNAFFATEGEQKAVEYLESLQYDLNKKRNERIGQAFYDFTNTKEETDGIIPKRVGPLDYARQIAGSLASIPASLLRGVGYIDVMAQNLKNQFGDYKPVDYNTIWQLPGDIADNLRQGVMDSVDVYANILGRNMDVFDFLYGTAMSGLDSAASAAAGPWGGAALIGLGAAQNTMKELVDRGANEKQVAIGSTLAGVFETLFEHVSIGHFYDAAQHLGKGSVKELLKNVTAEAGINFTEEFFTELADMIMEDALMGDKGEYTQLYNYLKDYGMTEEEARQIVAEDKAVRLLEEGFGGAIMGAFFGAGANLSSDIKASRFNADIGSMMQENGTAQMVYDLAKESTDSDVKKVLKGYDPAKATAKQTGRLFHALSDSLPAEMRGRVQGAMRDNVGMLAQNVLAPLTDGVIEAQQAAQAGQQLTEEQQKAIQDYYQGQAVADTIAALFVQEELTPEQMSLLAGSEKGMELVRSIWGETQEKAQNGQEQQEQQGQEQQGEAEEEWEAMPRANEEAQGEQQEREGKERTPVQPAVQDGLRQDQEQAEAPNVIAEEGKVLRQLQGDQAVVEEGQRQRMQQDNQTVMQEEAREGKRQADQTVVENGLRQDQEQAAAPNVIAEEGKALRQLQGDQAVVEEGQRQRMQQDNQTVMQEEAREGKRQADQTVVENGLKQDRSEGKTAPEVKTVPVLRRDAEGNQTPMQVTFQATENGMEAVDENGEAHDAAELELTEAQAAALQEAGALGDDAAANDLMDMVQGEEDAETARKKARAYGEAYRQGVNGVDFDEREKLWDDLTDEEARRAYEAGRRAAEAEQEARVNLARQAARADGYKAEADAQADEAGVFYGDVRQSVSNEQAKTNLRLLEQFAQDEGIHIVVHDDLGNLNGTYKKGDKTVHVSLNADDGALTRVATHEIYHYIKAESPEAGQQLQDFIIDTLRSQEGYDLEQRISDIQEQYRTAKGQELSRGEAMEEIAADAMGDVIGTEENLKKLARREQAINPGDLSLAERLKKWLGKMVERFRALQKKFQKNSPEGLALKDETDKMEKMRDTYMALLDAIKKNRAEGKAGLYSGIAQDADVQAYLEEKNSAATKEDADAALNGLLSSLFANTQQAWIGANADNYEQGYEDFVDALGKFGRGEINSVGAAMIQKGLDAPMGQKENQLYTYAARQIAENGKGERYMPKATPQEEWLLTPGEYRTISEDISAWKRGTQHFQSRANGGIIISSGNNLIVFVDKKGNVEHVLEVDVEDQDLNNIIFDEMLRCEKEGGDIFGNQQKLIDGYAYAGNTHFRSRGEVSKARRDNRRGTYRITESNRQGDRSGIPSAEGDTNGESFDLKRDADQNQRNQEAVENLRQDADLYAQMKQDADARAAYLLLMQLHDMTTRGGKDALIQKGAFEGRLSDIAQKILNEYGSEYGKNKLMKELRKVYQGMEQNQYSVSEMLAYTTDVMRDVLEKSPGTKMEQSEATKQILKVLQEKPFWLTSEQKAEIAELYGNTGIYRRKNVGKMRIVSKGMLGESLADLWTNELSPLMPEVFKEDAREQDMPMILDRWMQNAGSRRYSDGYGANAEAEAASMAINAILDFYDVPGALQTKEDIQKITWSARNAIRIAKEQYNQRYHELLKERTETKNKQELRKSIERTVKTINKLNVSPSDDRHVPEGMREAALDAVRPFLNDTSVFSQANLDRLNRIYGILAERKGEAAGFDEDILQSIQELGPKLNGRRLSQLTEQELSDINDIVGNIHKAITGANEAFIRGRKTTVDALSGRLKADMQDRTARQGKLAEAARKISYRETTPTYFADRAGGVIKEMVKDLFRGQETWAFTMQKAKAYADEQIDKYNVKQWINDKETLRFDTKNGGTIELNRKQAMSLYALWTRENTNKLQEAKHLRVGGFLYERGTNYKGVDTMRAHPLTDQDMAQIKSWLTPEQMEFVDKMVGYLSSDLSKAGNEVSMALYGYEKFKEAYYFPYVSDRRFLVGDLTQTGERQTQPKNKGFTKAVMRNAATPITISDFMDTWANHVNQMAIYAGFAETMDTMNRVLNDRVSGEIHVNPVTGEETVIAPESNWMALEKALGAEGVNYLKTLARDISGGVRADERGWAAKGLSRFKKSAVAGNLSVVLQQPTAYARAMMMVNPRYLLTANPVHIPAHIKRGIREMYKYSGVAIIKSMGKFDTGTGQSAVEWLQDEIKGENVGKRVLDFVDEWTGKGAEKADEWTWGLLWDAISKEVEHTRTDLTRGTDAFGQAVAERFNDVVNHTQVYDSVLSRSEWMRSNTTMDKMMTSFMAEPTLTLNMLQDAIVRYKEDGMGRKKVARAAGVFVLNALMVALLKSLMTATRRKNDEGRTWLEKYLAEAAGNFVDDVSPFGVAGLIPGVRDAISIFEGYDVARSDMDSITMLYKAANTLFNDDKTLEDKLQEAFGAVGNLLGVPVKNIWRDAEGMIRNIFLGASANEPNTGRDIKYSVLDNLKMGPISLWDSSRGAYYDRMEQAALKGDTKLYDELYGYLAETNQVKDTTIKSGVKGELKESVIHGLVTQEKAIDVLTKMLGMEEKKARDEIDKWIETAEHADDEDFSYSKYGELISLAKEGKDIKNELADLAKRGADEKTALGQLKSGIKDWYVSGGTNRETAEKRLKQYITTLDENDLYWLFDEWDAEKAGKKDEYSKYSAFYQAVDTGANLKSEVKRYLDNGVKAETMAGQITSQYKKQYVALMQEGKKTEAANLKARLLTAYEALGYNRTKKNKDIDAWLKQEEKKNK